MKTAVTTKLCLTDRMRQIFNICGVVKSRANGGRIDNSATGMIFRLTTLRNNEMIPTESYKWFTT